MPAAINATQNATMESIPEMDEQQAQELWEEASKIVHNLEQLRFLKRAMVLQTLFECP